MVEQLHTIESDLRWLRFVPDVETAVEVLASSLT
jgi:hypothetical protein